jgi:hypothetical protein
MDKEINNVLRVWEVKYLKFVQTLFDSLGFLRDGIITQEELFEAIMRDGEPIGTFILLFPNEPPAGCARTAKGTIAIELQKKRRTPQIIVQIGFNDASRKLSVKGVEIMGDDLENPEEDIGNKVLQAFLLLAKRPP